MQIEKRKNIFNTQKKIREEKERIKLMEKEREKQKLDMKNL